MKKHEKGFASILAILIIVVIGGGGFYVYKKDQDKKFEELKQVMVLKDSENSTSTTKVSSEVKSEVMNSDMVEVKSSVAPVNVVNKDVKTFNHLKGIYSLQYPKDLEITFSAGSRSTQFGTPLNIDYAADGDRRKDFNSSVGADMDDVEKELITLVKNKTEEKVTINSNVFRKYTGMSMATKKDFEYYLLPLEKFDNRSPYFAVYFNNADEFTRQDINLVLNSIKITNSPGEKIVKMVNQEEVDAQARKEKFLKGQY